MTYDVVIVGAGPAGITAAIYLRRAGKSVIMIERAAPGGKIFLTHLVENYPGIKTITGRELALNMMAHAKEIGVEHEYGDVQEIIDGDIKKVITNMNQYEAHNIIIATGTENRKLNVEGEEELAGTGISYCAVCDGNFFKGLDVVVVGGGNSAVEEAIYLAGICKSVTVIHRSDFRADKVSVEQLKNLSNVRFEPSSTVQKFIGEDGKLNQVIIKNNETGVEKSVSANGAFIYVGSIPNTKSFENLNILNETGHVIVNEKMETPVKGFYGAGDVLDKELRQIVTATNDGSIAAQAIINQK